MATNYIITGHTGEPHITSADVRALNASTLGADSYVLDINDKFEATIIDNHTINIASGDILMQGTHARIPYGSIETVYLEPGTAGYKRIDLIVARYRNTGEKEQVTFEVLQGESVASDPTAPAITTGDILHGDDINEFALYKVTFDGILIDACEPMYSVFAGFAAKKSTVLATLLASNWADKEYSLESVYPSESVNIEIQISSAADSDAIDAWSAAKIVAKGDLSNVIVAKGDQPTVDIPVILGIEVK